MTDVLLCFWVQFNTRLAAGKKQNFFTLPRDQLKIHFHEPLRAIHMSEIQISPELSSEFCHSLSILIPVF